jgi:PAS domain S-box-containing protein
MVNPMHRTDTQGNEVPQAGTARLEAVVGSQEWYRILFDSSPEPTILLGLDGTVLDGNQAALSSFGLRREDSVGRPFGQCRLFVEEDMSKCAEAFSRLLSGESVEPFPLRSLRDNKTPCWWECLPSLVRTGQEVIALQTVYHDITRQKQAEEALLEAEVLYHGLATYSRDAVWHLDPQLRFTFVSPTAKTLLDYEPQELVGESLAKILIDGEFDGVKDLLRRRLAGELPPEGITVELTCRRKDGTHFPVEVRTAPVWGPDGQLVGIEGITRDITDRKRAEEAYRTVVDQSLQGLIIIQDKRVVFANPAISNITGYTIDELRAMTTEQALAALHPDDLAIVADRYTDRLAGKALPDSYTLRGIRPDGSIYWAEIHSRATTYQGRPAVQAMVVDITDRKKAEDALKAAHDRLEVRVRERTAELQAANESLRREITEREHAQALLALQRDLGIALGSARNSDDVWRHFLDCALRIEGIDSGGIYVLDPAAGKLRLRAHRGLSPTFIDAVLEYDLDAPRVQVVMKGEPVHMSSGDPPLTAPDVRAEGLQSLAVIPLKREGRVIGSLNAASHTCEAVPVAARDALEAIAAQIVGVLARIEAEDALRRRERYFRALVENASDVVAVVNETGVIEYISPPVERVLGYRPEERLGRNVFELVHPDDAPRVIETFERGNRLPGHVESLEFRCRHKDGSWRVVEATGTNLLSDPAVGAVVINARDITERKLLAEALQRSEQLYRTLAESIPDYIFVVDKDDRIQYVNTFGAKMMRRAPADIIGRPRSELFPPDIRESQEESLRQVFESGQPLKTSRPLRFEWGGEQWVDTWLVPLPREAGAAPAVLGVSRDVTETKHAEMALRASQELLKKTFAAMREAVFIIDADTTKVLDCNPAACELFGYSRQEIVGLSIDSLHVDEAALNEFKRRLFAAVEERGYLFLPEYNMRRKDGTVFPTERSVTPLEDEQGKRIGWVGVVRDITERKRTQEALRRSEERYRTLFEESPVSLWEEDFSRVKAEIDKLAASGVRDLRAYFENHPEDVARCARMVRILDVNKSTLELYQAECKEDFFRGLDQVFTEASYGLFREQLIAIAEGATRCEGEAVNRTLKGKQIEVALRWYVAPGHEGTLSRVLVSINDITRRKHAEDALRGSEETLRALIDANPESLLIMGRDGTVLAANETAARRLGTRVEELVGRSAFPFLPPELAESRRARTAEVIRSGKPARFEDLRTGRWIENYIYPVLDAAGNVGRLAVLGVDVTQRKRAEEALRHRLAMEELVTDVSTRFINIASEDLDGEILLALKRLGESLGVDRAQVNLLSSDGTRIERMYEWPPREEGPSAVHAVGLSLEPFRWSMGRLRRFEIVHAPRVADLPAEAAPEKEGWLALGIQSLVAVPLVIGNSLVGFFGFATVHKEQVWLEEDHTLLKALGDVFTNALARKRAEETLRESEARYRAVVEDQSELICRYLPDGRVTFVNEAACRYFAKTREELMGRPFMPFIVEEDRDKVRGSIAALSPERPVSTVEDRGIAGDGQIRWQQWTNRAIFDEHGHVREYQAVGRDITDRKRAEEALRESEQRFRQLAENIQEVFWMTDPKAGKVLYVSPAYETVWGRSCQSLLADHDSWLMSVHPEDSACAAGITSRSYVKGMAEGEYRIVRPDGSVRWVHDRAFPIRNEAGEVYRIAGIAQDITERKAAEEALQRSERHFRSLIENAPDLITILDDRGTNRYESPSVYRTLGYAPQELVGRSVFDLVHPDDAPRAMSLFREILEQPGQAVSAELRYRHKDGSWRFFEGTAKNLLGDPAVAGIVLNTRDTTDRRRAEEASRVFARGMEQSHEAILITDANIRLTFANKAAEELLGCPSGEMLGHRPDEVFTIDPHTSEEIRTAMTRQRSWSGLIEGRNRQGQTLAVEMTSLLITDEREMPVATVSLLRDAMQTRRLESLQQMAEAVAGAEAADEKAVYRIMSHLQELVGVDIWAIYVHNPERETLEAHSFSEKSRALAEAVPSVPVAGSLQGEVLRTGEIVFTPDISNDYRFTRNPHFRKALDAVAETHMRATCVLPIRSGGRILGTLNVSDRRVRTFSPVDLTMLKTLASQVGLLLGREDRGSPDRPRPARQEPAEVVPVVAESETMKFIVRAAQRIAATDLPVILLGPTGSGKGHLAKYIHSISPRSSGPFLSVNCACLDGELILSELFGHERGAFTGAVRQQKGCFELAHGGTLLLDEVVELPQSAQAKLLQLVETQQFRRLGGQETITTDVRVICTTNADVRECVRTGKMRQDLYYRLSAGEIVIPPLCERPEDIAPLATSYLRTQALAMGQPPRIVTDAALARLREYHWPGNVRELQNVLALASAHGERLISVRDLHFSPAEGRLPAAGQQPTGRSEREDILEALRRNRWNRTLAAQELGMHRNTLRARMRKYDLFE